MERYDITKYFESSGSTKRQLSDQSNNGEEPKKQREEGSQTDSSSCWDNVFLEGIDTPNSSKASIISFMKNLELQIKDLVKANQDTKESQIKGEEHLKKVTESITSINARFDKLEMELKEKDQKISVLEGNINCMSETINKLNHKLDQQEQYSRRNCLLIHNLSEEKNEDTDKKVIEVIREKVGEAIEMEDLDRTHRLGAYKNGKSRPIIVKFSRYHVRNRIFRKKKNLKGKNVSITESLTKRRMEALNDARKSHGFENVWSSDGKILYKDQQEDKIKIYYD